MTAKTISTWILVGVVGVSLALGIAFYRVGKAHQAAAIEFWGEDYDLDDISLQLDWGFFGNIIMPRGGPMVSPEFIKVCPDTPLPLVPIKINADGTGQVLCGLGSDAIVMGFDVEKLDDAQFRDVFVDAINRKRNESSK